MIMGGSFSVDILRLWMHLALHNYVLFLLAIRLSARPTGPELKLKIIDSSTTSLDFIEKNSAILNP